MKYTREFMYQAMDQVDPKEMEELKVRVDQSIWRQHFHIQPNTGLLNDPNGFTFYNGLYHLFYQWYPRGPVHGLKHWYHLTSEDLVTWKDEGVSLIPDHYYESHGIFSGTALVKDEELLIFYTGNARDEEWNRTPSQVLATMDKNYKVTKPSSPIIHTNPEGYTDHVRDPKVWFENEQYWMILGAQRVDKTGATIIYSSKDLKEWDLQGELKTNYQDFGYMWECPDFFELDNKQVFIFSPQGLDAYPNIYQSGYLLGDVMDSIMDPFNHESFKELDHGFDFYAPQTMEHKGERVLVGWMGLPEIDYPSDKDGWAHCMTLPRVLNVVGGKLKQIPHPNLKKLRKESIDKNNINGAFEFEVNQGNLEIISDQGETLSITMNGNTLSVDRTQFGIPFATEYGTIRQVELDEPLFKIQGFVDRSSIELFINDGEKVMSLRYFTMSDILTLRPENGTIKVWRI